MRAILVIDVDDDLDLSQIHANVELYSNDLENTFHKVYLLKQVRPLPEKYYIDNSEEFDFYAEGYNKCLDEILGETE